MVPWLRVGGLRSMVIGSLFSGIGGLELGLELAGLGPVRWQVEVDPWCLATLEKAWPNARRFNDVRSVGGDNLPAVDLICGGFPCQDISHAGKGKGLSGERSGLWSEMLRIVREIGPRVVVVENVTALQRRGLDVVARGLQDAGYSVEATRIRAEDIGAPHRRERLFLVAYADRDALRERAEWQPSRPKEGLQKSESPEPRHVGKELAYDALRRHGFPPRRGDEDAWIAWEKIGGPQPGVCRSSHGFPSRLDGFARRNRLKALGNAVVPQVAEVVGRRILEKVCAIES